MTELPFVDEVAAHLADLQPRARAAALDELRGTLAEGVAADDLGSAASYADSLRAVFAPDPADPQAEAFGVPFEFRAAGDARVRSRIWDPRNPALFVPRLLGGGWALNLGAVAVRLRLLRPDDYDDDVLAHIPPAALTAVRAVPPTLAAATLAATIATWRTGRSRVVSSWDWAGRPSDTADRRVALPLLAGMALAPAAWSLKAPKDAEDALISSAVAASVAAVAAVVGAGTLRSTRDRDARISLAGMVAGAVALPLAMLVVPVRIGLRRVWASQQAGAASR